MTTASAEDIKAAVRDTYSRIASETRVGGCCGGGSSCGPSQGSRVLGYSEDELQSLPPGADLGLGCGNPHAIAALTPGETVLDLGSGAGIDAFLAARQVGPTGHVIGIDMTHDMLAKARRNAERIEARNVDFRLGEIEHLPVADAAVDVIMSNCVINLSTDKPAVFREAFRVLRPGGRLAITDMVATQPIPDAIGRDLAAYSGCIAGAARVDEIVEMLTTAGFDDVSISVRNDSGEFVKEWMPGADQYVVSALIQGVKPRQTGRARG